MPSQRPLPLASQKGSGFWPFGPWLRSVPASHWPSWLRSLKGSWRANRPRAGNEAPAQATNPDANCWSACCAAAVPARGGVMSTRAAAARKCEPEPDVEPVDAPATEAGSRAAAASATRKEALIALSRLSRLPAGPWDYHHGRQAHIPGRVDRTDGYVVLHAGG